MKSGGASIYALDEICSTVATDEEEMTPLVLVLPYCVSANRYWRTAIIGGHVQTYLSAEAKHYKHQIGLIAAQQQRPMLTGRLEMELWLYPHRPQDWAKRKERSEHWDDDVRCQDLGNTHKVMQDALQGIAYENDKQVWTMHLDRMEPDEHGARLVVRISEWSGKRDGLFDEAGIEGLQRDCQGP